MQRLFSVFPRGRPGAGLLLLRAVVGVMVVLNRVETVSAATAWPSRAHAETVVLIGGVLILAGFLTPIAAVCVGGVIVVSLHDFGDTATWLIATVCAALALLGPGAWSLDARLFGRREVVIPRPPINRPN